MSKRIILDCDPGHDDAMAILLAHGTPEIELAALTTVAGNHPLELTTLNARRICTLAGIKAPIAAGCDAPLLRPLVTAPEIHGTTGLEGHDWDEPTVSVVPEHAVDVIVDMVMASPGEITLVPVAPLTNLAMAVRREPRIASRVREVIVMGGAYTRGNVTPAAEFNIFVDPEAAAIVFEAGWPITMIGLEVTHMAGATREVLSRISALRTPVADAVVGMLGFLREQVMREHGFDAPHIHDACAVACAARPELVTVQDGRVDVEVTGRFTAGMTVTDFSPGAKFNAKVGTSLDVPAFWDMFVGSLAGAALPSA
ncbi:MAG TPA: nucleoside hydrolase [Candidatus Dormibacteraeota bacterium]|nr:nucleoside hydrolase [Candidatus Dormibacteraeota bacterium]